MNLMAIVIADMPEFSGVHDLFGRLYHWSLYKILVLSRKMAVGIYSETYLKIGELLRSKSQISS